MTQEVEAWEKYRTLRQRIRDLGSLLVAYSGGVDSTFLAKVATEELGDNALAVTAKSESFPEWERQEARTIAEHAGINHRVIETSELDIPSFRENQINRCYHCKAALFACFTELAQKEGLAYVADGTTADDISDHRPGRKAAEEQNVVSPLLACGMTKDDIRILSRAKNLPTWNKAAFACLASRIPYGEEITAYKLTQVEHAENFLRRKGIRQFRVRHHGDIARIEVLPADIPRVAEEFREQLVQEVRSLGFRYVTLDLMGYRTGSMNEVTSQAAAS